MQLSHGVLPLVVVGRKPSTLPTSRILYYFYYVGIIHDNNSIHSRVKRACTEWDWIMR